jgi:hypothetical protein
MPFCRTGDGGTLVERSEGSFFAFLLGPWPDLLDQEARTMGQIRWYLEVLKSFVPVLLALLATAGLVSVSKRHANGETRSRSGTPPGTARRSS